MLETLRRRARNRRGALAGYGGCLRCGDSWAWKEAHSTPYAENRSCFPLCEECWQKLTIEERVPYYEQLWARWQRELPGVPEYGIDRLDQMIAAVRAGE